MKSTEKVDYYIKKIEKSTSAFENTFLHLLDNVKSLNDNLSLEKGKFDFDYIIGMQQVIQKHLIDAVENVVININGPYKRELRILYDIADYAILYRGQIEKKDKQIKA